jgi:glycosyltransferase involved in cell wall biosynthesis
VIVPVLNDARGIEACVNALLRQTYPSDRYEIIVADNGSTDGTRGVVERLRAGAGSRLLLVVEDGVRSSYAARNLALGAASGQIVAFTDADCSPAASWLERGVHALDVRDSVPAGAAGRPRPQGDNELMQIGALDFDLARYRWPMTDRHATAFLEGYARHHSPESYLAHFPFGSSPCS